jgi:hypothetical protein
MTRILRCAACTKRIKPHHPHVGLIDLGASPGREICYHARPECHERGAAQIAAMMERGKALPLLELSRREARLGLCRRLLLRGS